MNRQLSDIGYLIALIEEHNRAKNDARKSEIRAIINGVKERLSEKYLSSDETKNREENKR